MVLADTEADAEALGVEGLLGVELLGVEFELHAAPMNATATTATRRVLCIGGAYPPSGCLDPAVGKKTGNVCGREYSLVLSFEAPVA
jgi:hypothetical protein